MYLFIYIYIFTNYKVIYFTMFGAMIHVKLSHFHYCDSDGEGEGGGMEGGLPPIGQRSWAKSVRALTEQDNADPSVGIA